MENVIVRQGIKQRNRILNMKKTILSFLAVVVITTSLFAQDKRTLDTKVADILAQLPVKELSYKDKLMQEILDLGEPGIDMFCDMIVAPGTGDDTQARVALESLARYASKNCCSTSKQELTDIYLKELKESSNKEIQKFYLRRLNLIAGSSAIDAVKIYITDSELSTSAIATLQSIGTEDAAEAILSSISELSDDMKITAVKSLGDMKYSPAYNTIVSNIETSNSTLKSTILYTISKLGNPAAYDILLKEAKAADFMWDSSEALTSFVTFAKEMGRADNMDICNKATKVLFKASGSNGSVQTSIYALDIMSVYSGYDALPTLQKEFTSSDCKRYRVAILSLAEKMADISAIREWCEIYKDADANQQEELINFFSTTGSDVAFNRAIEPALNSSDSNVRAAALTATVNRLGDCSYSKLVEYSKKWDTPSDIAVVKESLTSGISSKMIDKLGDEIDSSSEVYRPLFITAIANRRLTNWFNSIYSYATGNGSSTKSAAITGLSKVAKGENSDDIIKLLDKSNSDEETASIQEALMSCINDDSQEGNFDKVLQYVERAKLPENFYNVLANKGGAEALTVITAAYKRGNDSQKSSAFSALANWRDASALYTMLNIIREGKDDSKTVTLFTSSVSKASVTDQKKLLLLREAYEYADDTETKLDIISKVGNTKTFLSLKFVSQFLESKELANGAGKSAMKIALPTPGKNNGLTGKFVTETLNKTIAVISGDDSQYWKIDIEAYLENMRQEQGYISMFNGKDLTGWEGYIDNPIKVAKMSERERAEKQAEADKAMVENWYVKDGAIWFKGKGHNLLSKKKYGDFEMVVDWRITPKGDSGIYLRGTPQIQIWDTTRVEVGAQVGSGGLYNNQKNRSTPLKVADNPIDEWNTFNIKMIGEKVTVYLNGELVVDNVTMENYWDRGAPILPEGTIELQAHGTDLAFRDIYVKEIDSKGFNLTPEEKSDGFTALFNGQTIEDNWQGNLTDYSVVDGEIDVNPKAGGRGNLYTKKEYDNFIFRFEFKLTPGANNGLGIHAPLTGDAAYMGKELQILDNSASVYANLRDSQYHGSVYGVIAAKRGAQNPVGEWNYEEVIVNGDDIKITLNGVVIVDGNMAEASKNGTLDHKDHPGLKKKRGYIGFLGHGSPLKFRNIRIKEL